MNVWMKFLKNVSFECKVFRVIAHRRTVSARKTLFFLFLFFFNRWLSKKKRWSNEERESETDRNQLSSRSCSSKRKGKRLFYLLSPMEKSPSRSTSVFIHREEDLDLFPIDRSSFVERWRKSFSLVVRTTISFFDRIDLLDKHLFAHFISFSWSPVCCLTTQFSFHQI